MLIYIYAHQIKNTFIELQYCKLQSFYSMIIVLQKYTFSCCRSEIQFWVTVTYSSSLFIYNVQCWNNHFSLQRLFSPHLRFCRDISYFVPCSFLQHFFLWEPDCLVIFKNSTPISGRTLPLPLTLTLFLYSSPFTVGLYTGPVASEGEDIQDTGLWLRLQRRPAEGTARMMRLRRCGCSMKEETRSRRDGYRSWTFTYPVLGKMLWVRRAGSTCSGALDSAWGRF